MADEKQVIVTTQSASGSKILSIILAVVILASLAANGIFIKNYYDLKQGSAEREKIILDQKEAIEKQDKMISALNAKLADWDKKIEDLKKQQENINKKKKDDTIHYSKPLPKPEEDQFFADHGFKGKRTDDSGRMFTNEDVVKVQLLIKDNENLQAELGIANKSNVAKDSMIELYKEKCLSQEKIIASYKEIDEQRQTEIKKYKSEIAANKLYKWTAIIVGGALVGYAAAH